MNTTPQLLENTCWNVITSPTIYSCLVIMFYVVSSLVPDTFHMHMEKESGELFWLYVTYGESHAHSLDQHHNSRMHNW